MENFCFPKFVFYMSSSHKWGRECLAGGKYRYTLYMEVKSIYAPSFHTSHTELTRQIKGRNKERTCNGVISSKWEKCIHSRLWGAGLGTSLVMRDRPNDESTSTQENPWWMIELNLGGLDPTVIVTTVLGLLTGTNTRREDGSSTAEWWPLSGVMFYELCPTSD